MAWMRMPGDTWLSATASFLAMWVGMMVAMMLPSLAPALWRYRQALVRTAATHSSALIALAALGYFFVWTVIGTVAYPIGVALAATEMHYQSLARVTPIAGAAALLLAGLFQLTAWKARHLDCWRSLDRVGVHASSASAAWGHGLRLGFDCVRSCGNLMLILVVIGVMDVGAMVAVTAAITAERLTPAGARVARATGVVVVVAAMVLMAREGAT